MFASEQSRIFTKRSSDNWSVSLPRYGLKTGATDVVDDGGCDIMPSVEGLYFLRSPDSIATFEKDGSTYVITANEGDSVEYGNYTEMVGASAIFNGTSIGYSAMTCNTEICDSSDITVGQSRYFNANCNAIFLIDEGNSDTFGMLQ